MENCSASIGTKLSVLFPNESLSFRKKKKNLKLFEFYTDKCGTKVFVFKKKINAKPLDTLKLYFPNPNQIIKETTDLCKFCKTGYWQQHPVIFKNNTHHIQVTCSFCHRYICYLSQQGQNECK